MEPSIPQTLDLTRAQDVTPPRVSVVAPLSGKERAGVSLTWGVLGLITGFLILVITFLWRQEAVVQSVLQSAERGAAIDTVRFRLIAGERSAFRAFWLQVVQMVLVNVLLPVLTALLGYVFGTQAARAGNQGT